MKKCVIKKIDSVVFLFLENKDTEMQEHRHEKLWKMDKLLWMRLYIFIHRGCHLPHRALLKRESTHRVAFESYSQKSSSASLNQLCGCEVLQRPLWTLSRRWGSRIPLDWIDEDRWTHPLEFSRLGTETMVRYSGFLVAMN
jgi:hypothetical protein